MRSTLLLAALAAGCVSAFEKRVYVTDWTTVTVTETITAPTVTETVPAVEKVPVVITTSTSVADVEANTDLFKKSTVPPESATSAAPVVPVSTEAATTEAAKTEAAPTEAASTSYWSTAWTSTIEAAAPSSTLATSTSASSASSATASATNAYQQAVLYNHNIHRSNHSVSSLEWSADLESSAQTLAARCTYEHDTSIDGGGYGQNIGYGVEASDVGVMITNLMYNDEIEFFPTPYGESDPSMTDFDKWGHFSQIVWKATTHVGCATVVCNPLGNVDSSEALPFTVCNYSPVGNVGGEYGDNVLKPDGGATYSA
ncbi:uncharacterized protein N7484_001987 [Penicillium longicatenatum]|uniref:uncharacterized protein n=1 Tax=Penicillium longicatenatum TaxID=1561947 RepID=UPI002547CBCD|nr:uncharacterized protein N7484_001987 [Penicillium longicatenatum]KAJ5658338.1 hypothetical protein N7484_001987 [Penicillium longicatenatum]